MSPEALHAAATRPTQSIFIEGMRIDARIGVHPHEQGREQPLELDAEIEVDDARFHPVADRLREVFDYQAVRAVILQVVATGHIHLLETLAGRVIESLLALPDVQAVRIRIRKFTAFEDCRAVGVEVRRRRIEANP